MTETTAKTKHKYQVSTEIYIHIPLFLKAQSETCVDEAVSEMFRPILEKLKAHHKDIFESLQIPEIDYRGFDIGAISILSKDGRYLDSELDGDDYARNVHKEEYEAMPDERFIEI